MRYLLLAGLLLALPAAAPPDLARGFYRGTRFDQAGVVTSLTFKGRDFYGPWFEARLNPSSDLIASAV